MHLNRRFGDIAHPGEMCVFSQKPLSISSRKSKAESSCIPKDVGAEVPTSVGQIQSHYPQDMICRERDSIHSSPAQGVENDFHGKT